LKAILILLVLFCGLSLGLAATSQDPLQAVDARPIGVSPLKVRDINPKLNVAASLNAAGALLDNGTVSIEIARQTGDILALRYRGQSVLSGPAYLDWHTGVNNHLRNGQLELRVDPATNGGQMAEVSITQRHAGSSEAFDVELHHVLRRGDSGFYSYAVFRHPAGYPQAGLGQARMVFRLNDALFDFINVDDQRRRLMPPSDTPSRILGPKESIQFTEGPFKGLITDKYHFFVDAGEHFVHGWTGTRSHLGCWVLYGSNEDRNGGPTKQHNTAHFDRLLLKILTCGHYGSAGVNAGAELWEKLYGPWMVYLNGGGSPDELWADAKQKAAVERAAWPYPWMRHPLYPLAGERGTVTGRLQLDCALDLAASPANAWVGLAAPKPNWQQQSAGYQFWVRAGADGGFTIPAVRPGEYTLYAFVDGVMGEFRRDGIAVNSGGTNELGALAWKPVHYGRLLWQVGISDRTGTEFRHGDDYRQWGLWQKYREEFPQDVNFLVGRSLERTDWNYSQVTVLEDGGWRGTKWNVLFDLAEPLKPGTATLRIAFAAAKAARIRVSVNGTEIGDSGRFGDDNAMIRAGIHGQYSEWDLPFATALLKPGRNRLTLEQSEGGNNLKNVMYDCLRLEVNETLPPPAARP
jgi:rhamnogalacturonan endolyase